MSDLPGGMGPDDGVSVDDLGEADPVIIEALLEDDPDLDPDGDDSVGGELEEG
jgi:hypothetical protein